MKSNRPYIYLTGTVKWIDEWTASGERQERDDLSSGSGVCARRLWGSSEGPPWAPRTNVSKS